MSELHYVFSKFHIFNGKVFKLDKDATGPHAGGHRACCIFVQGDFTLPFLQNAIERPENTYISIEAKEPNFLQVLKNVAIYLVKERG